MEYVQCANCGKTFPQSKIEAWSDLILGYKPACSYECNKALGQVRKA